MILGVPYFTEYKVWKCNLQISLKVYSFSFYRCSLFRIDKVKVMHAVFFNVGIGYFHGDRTYPAPYLL